MNMPVTWHDVRDSTIGALATAGALFIAHGFVDGYEINYWLAPILVAVLVGSIDTVIRPRLRPVANQVGVPGTLLIGALFQLAAVRLSICLVPGTSINGWGATLWVLAIVGTVVAVTRWAIGAGDRDYQVADLIRHSRKARAEIADDLVTGLVVVQIDGLAYPVLQHAISSGDTPNLARWLREGSHMARAWWARIPSTTPASMAGLLHGTNDDIPAFRWYDKKLGRLVVTNRPADAALVEKRLSDGNGLLSGGGAAVSTIFAGDAATARLVISRAGSIGGLGPGGDYLRFFARPFILARVLLLTVGEMIKEVAQASHQRRRGVWPRVPRGWRFVVLRAVTNVVMRDLNVALVADQMAKGTPVIYVDLVDYDEIAHHAGVARREAMDALAGVDAAIGTLERFAEFCPRDYRFVITSDHGQSQGATFAQLAGRPLGEIVDELTDLDTVSSTGAEEAWGPLATLLSDLRSSGRPKRAQWTAGARGVERHTATHPDNDMSDQAPAGTVVAASGNLGLIWFPQIPGRAQLVELDERFPALVPGLLRQPGVGFVVVETAQGAVVIGAGGVRNLSTGAVDGADPLAGLPHQTAGDLQRVAAMSNCPDVLVHSTVEQQTAEVHAFEELAGSHGGVGGAQNLAVLLHPSEWEVDPTLMQTTVAGEPAHYGANAVYRQLVVWLEQAGIRSGGPSRPGEDVTP